MINDDLDHHASTSARRTLPVVRSLKVNKDTNNIHSSAPLTRQLLTERPTTSQESKVSLLRAGDAAAPPAVLPSGERVDPAAEFPAAVEGKPKNDANVPHKRAGGRPVQLAVQRGMLNPPMLERRSLREPNEKGMQVPARPQSCVDQKLVQSDKRSPALVEPRSTTPRELKHLNGGSMHEKHEKIPSPPLHEVKKLPVRNEMFNQQNRFPFMQNNGNGSGLVNNNVPPKQPPHFSSALVGLSNQHLQQQALASVAAGIENMFDNDGALSLVVNRNAEQGNVTPRKKRNGHSVDTASSVPVARSGGQLRQSSGGALPPEHVPDKRESDTTTPPPHPQQHQNPPQQARTPTASTHVPVTPASTTSRACSTPIQSNPFFHPGAIAAAAAAAGHPMQPAPDQSPPSPTKPLRVRGETKRDEHGAGDEEHAREPEHHVTSLREYPSVRGLRDRGSVMISGNDILDMISNRAGSAGANSDSGGESNSAGFGELANSSGMYCHSTSTLTPMHLRKAKLMFFWTRYPSSAVIKMYFPDIKFNKNNTAQLVKWFSNFREFYYIQMEKYARQALSEGVKSAEDLHVTNDSELYRVLNLHYNRNNHIEVRSLVPTNFRFVVEQTLREFFKSVQAGKDSEQSWKKAIYKQIIARLDDPVPEYFKSPNFLEQLE
ncbi:Homeobox protein prospero [Orchesella cincta]|uniref:Homeobox protein prospero n=1 Tax=Orchesella cincta TaxID=48709 RepID=A0A1D2MLK9_ORCCI|nr:Homeobox protein prospero [Orchesella cincta]